MRKIEKMMDELGIKAPTFAKNVKVGYQQIFDIQSGRVKSISGNLAQKINKVYPQYTLEWLLSPPVKKEKKIVKQGVQNTNRTIDNSPNEDALKKGQLDILLSLYENLLKENAKLNNRIGELENELKRVNEEQQTRGLMGKGKIVRKMGSVA